MMRKNRDYLSACALFCALAFGLGGCATTQVEATWSSPEFAGRTVTGKMLVVGVTRDETVRRLYEDAMVVRLHGRGVDAVRSYDLVSARLADSDGSVLIEAAKRVGATRILSTAIVGREHVQRIEVEPVPPLGWNYYGWYGYYWPYGYARTETYDFDRYYASTTLTEVSSGKVYWSARTRSDAPGRIEKAVDDFVSVMVDTLARSGLL
jgi:hypothetical protein